MEELQTPSYNGKIENPDTLLFEDIDSTSPLLTSAPLPVPAGDPSSPPEAGSSTVLSSSGFTGSDSMSSTDELFLNDQIRPMKLSTHLERPQVLAPLLDLEVEDQENEEVEARVRGRDMRLYDKSLCRRTISLSPIRNTPLEWTDLVQRLWCHEWLC